MRILVYEHLCAGDTDSALRTEGWAMLSAIVEDFEALPDCEVWTLLDERVPKPLGGHCQRVRGGQVEEALCQLTARADATLVIAPETGGILARLNRLVLTAEAGTENNLSTRTGPNASPLPRYSGGEGSGVRGEGQDQSQHFTSWQGVLTPSPLPLSPGVPGERGKDVPPPMSKSDCLSGSPTNGRLLGCDPRAVELTTDKKILGDHWRRHGVPTPEVIESAAYPGFAVVLKPRDGAGSQATFLIDNPQCWTSSCDEARQEHAGEFILQRFAEGQAASVAFLIGRSATIPLVPVAQHLSDDGRFHYRGGALPLVPNLASRALSLASRAIECVPGLAGYVGVDLVLGHAADGKDDVAMEINPRLTTSYLGLRRLCRQNLAEIMWRLFRGEKVSPLTWHPGSVLFHADKRLTTDDTDGTDKK